MNIIIPMAGRGNRFAEKGYIKPKPFIDVEGYPMIEKVIRNINNHYPNYIFICLKEFVDKYGKDFELLLKKLHLQYNIVTVDKVTEGAACTVLLAEKYINNEDELVIANCDQLVMDSNYFPIAVDHFCNENADAGIVCFLADHPKWSYVKLENDKVVEVAEKKVISNLATVGIYYYKHGKDFVSAANQMIFKNIRINNEFYVCPVFNEMIKNNKKIIPYMVNKMYGIGTPEDLELYLKRKI